MAADPERTCVGCRSKGPKNELVRLVVTQEGVRVDHRGSAPGRGAYLHPDRSCVEAALKHGAIGHALRAAIRGEEVSNLLRDIAAEA